MYVNPHEKIRLNFGWTGIWTLAEYFWILLNRYIELISEFLLKLGLFQPKFIHFQLFFKLHFQKFSDMIQKFSDVIQKFSDLIQKFSEIFSFDSELFRNIQLWFRNVQLDTFQKYSANIHNGGNWDCIDNFWNIPIFWDFMENFLARFITRLIYSYTGQAYSPMIPGQGLY